MPLSNGEKRIEARTTKELREALDKVYALYDRSFDEARWNLIVLEALQSLTQDYERGVRS